MAHGNNTENSNSTMEMGTSDQVLVTTKRKNKLTYVIGGMAMFVTVCVVVILIVMLSGNEAGVAEPIVSRRVSTEPNVLESAINSTQVPKSDNGLKPIELEDIISGVFSPLTFNGSWTLGNDILHRNTNGDLVLYNLETGNSTTLISNTSKILEQSTRVMELSPDGSHVILSYNVAPVYRYTFLAKYGVIDISSGYVRHVLPPGLTSKEAYLQNFVWAPTGTGLAFVYLNNVYYQQNLTSTPQEISSNGKLNVVYNGIPDWVYEEEVFLSNNALWFSPDGNKLAYVTFDDSDVRVMRVPHYAVPGTDFQYTQHHEIRYPKPGTTNPTVTVTLRDLQTGANDVFNGPDDLDQPILKTVRFATNDTVAIMWTNRVQTTLMVVLCSPGQTECKEIYRYTEENGWLDNNPLMFNKEGNAFITLQPQIVDGALFRQIVQISSEKNSTNDTNWVAEPRTNSKYTVGEILLWTDNDLIWYKATHVNDSAEQHVYYVDSSGNETCFTCGIKKDDGGECLYNDGLLSADGSRITITCGGPGVPQVFIYNTNKDLLKIWEDNSETAAIVSTRAMPKTVRLSVPTAVGYPDADVLLQVPHDYLSRKNIPLLVHVYGGPDTAFVTKLFNVDWGTSLVSRWGIAVAFIDGRGSGLKGSEYMFAVNRRLGTVEIEDQINVTRYLQENLSFLDRNRTCIWGWSYGAYAASLALARGDDVFRCAIAVAPVADWKFYDSIYTERYMDTPRNNSRGYLEGSLLTEEMVKAFRKKRYFLVHGTADDNVHYQHAMLISRVLQTQDVSFTQMSYTDEDHGLMGVRPHLYHGLEKFLEENML